MLKRNSYGMIVGSGYEGRVDVSEDELRKGICSLVLKNVRIIDGGVYKTQFAGTHTHCSHKSRGFNEQGQTLGRR